MADESTKGTTEEQIAALAEQQSTALKKLKGLGYDSFDEYQQDIDAKLAKAQKQIDDSQGMIKTQGEELGKLRKVAVAPKGREEPGAEGGSQEEMASDPFEKMAKELYASLTPEEQELADAKIADLPQEVLSIASSGFEGKFAVLQGIFPEKKVIATKSDGGFFGDLKPAQKKKTISEQIAEALGNKGAAPTNVAHNKSGYTGRPPVKHEEQNRSSEVSDISTCGLYKSK